jgi:hypothetical protein
MPSQLEGKGTLQSQPLKEISPSKDQISPRKGSGRYDEDSRLEKQCCSKDCRLENCHCDEDCRLENRSNQMACCKASVSKEAIS